MNISAAAQNNPALILLQSTLQAVTLASSAAQHLTDTVDISEAAKQLARTVAARES